MRRISSSLSERAAAAIDQMAREAGSSVAGVIEAAGLVIAEGGAPASAIRAQVVVERRGGPRAGAGRREMTARDEIIVAMRALEARHSRQDFKVDEILQEVFARGSEYKESTIRTHIVSRMCGQAPNHHGVTYRDLDRTSHGYYRLANRVGMA
jgi:hypothetical protein